MKKGQIAASIHQDYLPFIALASDEELGQFVRAQICQYNGEEAPELTGVAKALFEAHTALVERLEESSRRKSESGKMGGNPALKGALPKKSNDKAVDKQCLSKGKAVDKQRLSSGKAADKPRSVSSTVSSSVTKDTTTPIPPPGADDGGEDVLGVPVESLAEQQERLDYVERELRKNGFRANDGMMSKALALVEQVGHERFEEALSAANGAGTTHWNYVLKASGAGPPGGPKNGDKDENGRVWLDGRWVLV